MKTGSGMPMLPECSLFQFWKVLEFYPELVGYVTDIDSILVEVSQDQTRVRGTKDA